MVGAVESEARPRRIVMRSYSVHKTAGPANERRCGMAERLHLGDATRLEQTRHQKDVAADADLPRLLAIESNGDVDVRPSAKRLEKRLVLALTAPDDREVDVWNVENVFENALSIHDFGEKLELLFHRASDKSEETSVRRLKVPRERRLRLLLFRQRRVESDDGSHKRVVLEAVQDAEQLSRAVETCGNPIETLPPFEVAVRILRKRHLLLVGRTDGVDHVGRFHTEPQCVDAVPGETRIREHRPDKC